MLTKTEIQTFINYCKTILNLSKLTQIEEYGYHNIPLCIIDAVFSIGVNYNSTENTVKRFCEHFGVTYLREKELSPQSEQLPVSSFIKFHQGFTFLEMAEKVYNNKQRTSTRNGILKAEAAYLFAEVVQKFGVEYLQDAEKILGNEKFEAEIARIPGQGSGDSGTGKAFDQVDHNRFSLHKLFCDRNQMLYPYDHALLNRHSVHTAIGRELSMDECQELLLAAHAKLVRDHPLLTPRSLDHEIWVYQRTT